MIHAPSSDGGGALMPRRPPVFRSRGSAPPRKAWTRRHPVDRIRGRAGVKLRRLVLREEPLCRPCLDVDRTTASEEVDHIVPLAEGGTNDRSNLQGICKPCHKAKSVSEADAGRRR